jgi:hypothetical protein
VPGPPQQTVKLVGVPRDTNSSSHRLKGQFLVDRDGIVSWANVECAAEGIARLGKFPTNETILAAAQRLR